jgi:hypothetical protein
MTSNDADSFETMTRKVTIELTFLGDGRVIHGENGGGFSGDVVSPKVDGGAAFFVHREVLGEDGIWNPVLGEGSLEGGLQINIWADSDGYRELGRYLLALAELDASADPGFHEHHDGLISLDGRTRMHIICRKAPKEDWH